MSCIKILKSGARIESLTEEERKTLDDLDFDPNYSSLTIRVQPSGYIVMDTYIEFAEKYLDFKFKSDDVLIMGFPKSGTTWAEEIVWTMLHNPNLNNEEAKKPIFSRVLFFEYDIILKRKSMPALKPGNVYYDAFIESFPNEDPNDGIRLKTIEKMQSPRILKTHLLFSLLPQNLLDTCKVIYIARNPKDVVVSYYHFNRLMNLTSYKLTLQQFTEMFMKDLATFCPYWHSVKTAWEKRDHPNLHFMFYEDLKANPKQEFTLLQNFLKINLTERQINEVIQYTSFEAMKERDNLNFSKINKNCNKEIEEKEGGFFRKGVTGDSKNSLSEEEMSKIDEWIKENTKDLSPEFKYKI